MQPAAQPTSRLALGLAALGRPAYITLDHGDALGADRSVEALRQRAFQVLDAAYDAGIRHVDAARSYGRAEEFLAGWLASRPETRDVIVSSKWGYRYVGNWQVDADVHEVKDHSLDALRRQWSETKSLLGSRVRLYQVHSVTPDSPLFSDRALLDELGRLRDAGVRIGLSTSGPHQADVVGDAIGLSAGGAPVFSAVQATWNLLERSVGAALDAAAARGWSVMVKEVLANGRLAGPGAPALLVNLARQSGVTPDALSIAAALALPSRPTVLLGPVSTSQLTSNLAALDVDRTILSSDLSQLTQAAASYWQQRSTLRWQ